MGVPTVIYTVIGGVQAVTWTDVKIMVLILFGMCAVIARAVLALIWAAAVVVAIGDRVPTTEAEAARRELRRSRALV